MINQFNEWKTTYGLENAQTYGYALYNASPGAKSFIDENYEGWSKFSELYSQDEPLPIPTDNRRSPFTTSSDLQEIDTSVDLQLQDMGYQQYGKIAEKAGAGIYDTFTITPEEKQESAMKEITTVLETGNLRAPNKSKDYFIGQDLPTSIQKVTLEDYQKVLDSFRK